MTHDSRENGDLEMDDVVGRVVRCPSDKSVTHRAIIFSALAKGRSTVERPLLGADCLSTIDVLRSVGVSIVQTGTIQEPQLEIDSPGWQGWKSTKKILDFGNSGTTARLMIGVFAAIPGLRVKVTGDASLRSRPMARVVEPLRRCGANITGEDNGQYLPLTIEGRQLDPCLHEYDKPSAQVKSGLILAGLMSPGRTSVRLPLGGRDHTETMLLRSGARIDVSREDGYETVAVEGPFQPGPSHYRIPGDPSSAAFWAVYGCLTRKPIRILGVMRNKTRTGFLTVLERMGAEVRLQDARGGTEADERLSAVVSEPAGDLLVSQGDAGLRGVNVGLKEARSLVPTLIDEIPILAVAMAFAKGTSCLEGLGELRVKESDRLAKTVELLQAAGAQCHSEGDTLKVAGGLKIGSGFTFDPGGDHRLAMSAAILSRLCRGETKISDASCVEVSYPDFFDVLNKLG